MGSYPFGDHPKSRPAARRAAMQGWTYAVDTHADRTSLGVQVPLHCYRAELH